MGTSLGWEGNACCAEDWQPSCSSIINWVVCPNRWWEGDGHLWMHWKVSPPNYLSFVCMFVCRYNLEANDSVQASESQHALYDDIAESQQQVKYLAGGAAQNTIRVAQVINIAHLYIYIIFCYYFIICVYPLHVYLICCFCLPCIGPCWWIQLVCWLCLGFDVCFLNFVCQ